MKSVETELGPVCSRCASAVPPNLKCTSCGRCFASATERTRALAQWAIAVHDERLRKLRCVMRREPEGVPG